MERKWLLGMVQSRVTDDKKANIANAETLIREAAGRGARVVVLPEMYNCPYDSRFFASFAESYPVGETCRMMARTAAETGIYLFGGSIPEQEGDRIYNTAFVFGPDGALLGKHRKVHLFDVELEGGVRFCESSAIGAGQNLTVVETEYGPIGVAICYDIRFPEVARALSLRGAVLMVLPAAFNMVTGPAHWEITLRMRAVDNQFYVAGVSPARDEAASYVAYGHSMAVDPWGRVLGSLDEKEGLLFAEIDLDRLDQVRREFPLLKHRRTDVYDLQDFTR